MNSRNNNGRGRPRSITAKKKLEASVSPKDDKQFSDLSQLIIDIIASTALCAAFALPTGGFVLGLVISGEEYGANVIERVGAGIACVFFTTISGGYPWKDFADGGQYNAWPYIIAVTPILYFMLFRWLRKDSRRRKIQ